ncbi:MAG: protein kinase [Deltaproteobacteria bacterium]|nr:protein kinase [Deltaproteobacteria bacterium]
MPPSRPALGEGELLEGKYKITRELGRGAMGVVYEALHVALGRRVAVKTLIEGAGADAEMGARFEREARAASAIGHAHIIDVFDLGRTKDGLLFMVMELLDGRSLETILKQTPKLPLSQAIDLMSQVLSGLGAAHKNGIVHRDLKPDNIFVINEEERSNFVKIVDFGISKVLGPQAAGPAATAKFAGTMVGAVLGTPYYMSPEQAIGQVTAIDHRTDIYSAGVVLYEMLCGRTPFLGKTYPEVLGQILEGKYQKPSELRPDIPPAIEAAIARALSRDIGARFPSAAAMRAEIAGGQAEITLAPVATGPPPAAPAVADGEPIVLSEATPAPRALGKRAARPGADPFAPPPEADLAPLLAGDLDQSVAFRPSPASRPVPQPEPERFVPRPAASPRERAAAPRDLVTPVQRPAPPPRERTMAPPESGAAPKKRPWLLIAVGLLLAAVAARFAYGIFGPGGKTPLLPALGRSQKVTLVVEPKEASVQIDHVPVTAGVLPLHATGERPHVLNAAASGRITRRFAFTVKPGMTLSVRLSHTLDVPSPTDPPPLSAELDTDYPENPRPAAEIDGAFAKLGRYADCLPLADAATADAKKGRSRPGDDALGPCQLAVAEAADTEPAFPELRTAAEAFLGALQKAHKPETLARAATSFRAEFLAARAAWQVEELSRQGKEEGQKPAWHMRRIALAAQSWLRSRKASPPNPQAVEDKRAKLDQVFSAFMNYVRLTPQALEKTSGATDFVSAAEEVVALANGAGGRKATEFSALDACRKLVAAFNALVVE